MPIFMEKACTSKDPSITAAITLFIVKETIFLFRLLLFVVCVGTDET